MPLFILPPIRCWYFAAAFLSFLWCRRRRLLLAFAASSDGCWCSPLAALILLFIITLIYWYARHCFRQLRLSIFAADDELISQSADATPPPLLSPLFDYAAIDVYWRRFEITPPLWCFRHFFRHFFFHAFAAVSPLGHFRRAIAAAMRSLQPVDARAAIAAVCCRHFHYAATHDARWCAMLLRFRFDTFDAADIEFHATDIMTLPPWYWYAD